jgi:hypothetical protein
LKEAQELISHYLSSLPLVTKFKEESKVIYESEDGKEEKVFDALIVLTRKPALWAGSFTSHRLMMVKSKLRTNFFLVVLRFIYLMIFAK